jgi:Asp-tRNA(Asn)/Glu-tRNA(Gln) amidotransferase A subunit family amidase
MPEKKQRRAGVSRRDLLKAGLTAGTAAAGLSAVDAQTVPADAITAADLAVADRVAGRAYSETERALMARSAGRIRAMLQALRAADITEGAEPALHFDPRVPGMELPRGKSGFRLSSGPLPRYDGNPESLAFASAVDLSRLLKARRVTSTELTRMYLDRLKRYGPRLLAVVNITEELALTQAARADREIAAGKYRGPLHGIPWGAKDLLHAKGTATTYGIRPYEKQMSGVDATVVRRLEEAGAVLIAKLTLGELAMGDVWFGGRTRSPWNPAAGSSGSSAGPGSATAAGLVGFSIGSETLGSIVSPSTVNGVTGLRPTYGRVPRTGAMALCWTMDKLGPMCRGVEDCAMILSAIHGPDGQDLTVHDVPFRWDPNVKLSSLRIGIDRAAFDAVMRNEKRAPIYREALAVLERQGVKPMPITLPPNNAAYGAIASVTIDCESAAAFQKLTAAGRLGKLVQQAEGSWPNTFRIGSTIPASDYIAAQQVRAKLQREMAEALKDVDCFITIPFASANLVYTNLTGHPTVVTRCGMLDGAPQMIEFTGQLYREDAILRLAMAYEQGSPWHRQWPDTSTLPETPPGR